MAQDLGAGSAVHDHAGLDQDGAVAQQAEPVPVAAAARAVGAAHGQELGGVED